MRGPLRPITRRTLDASPVCYGRRRERPIGPTAPFALPTPPASVDDETVSRFRSGDRVAFVLVYDTFGSAVRALVCQFFKSPFEREEAAQEIWLQVHRVAAAYDPAIGALSAWLRTVAKNRCRELLRARRRRPDPREEVDESTSAPDDVASPDAAMRRARARVAVERFSSELPEGQAAMLKLSLMEERTHDEVAALTGQSARQCKYLRKKLLERAAANAALLAALKEVIEP